MQHNTAATPSPPDPRLPTSFFVMVLHALLVAIFFNPIPAANETVVQAASTANPSDWIPPIREATEADVLRTFVPPKMPWSAAHRGIDIRAPGDRVLAPYGGEVTFVGVVVDRPLLSIRHPNGLVSSVEPVESDLVIGETVVKGQAIGTVSVEVSHCDVQCVHWGVRKPDAWQIGSTVRDLYIDPAFLLGWSEPSILWPIHSDPAS